MPRFFKPAEPLARIKNGDGTSPLRRVATAERQLGTNSRGRPITPVRNALPDPTIECRVVETAAFELT